tara:strand:+ start:231 stop:653 length:423 start_codon:yes stop_codon:yes gene_type:complete
MAGEINTTNTLVQNSSGVIVGQGAFTHTFGGTPIEISNKSYGDNVTYLDGELSAKQHVFSGEFVYNNDAEFRVTRTSAFSGTQDTYTLTYVGSGAVSDESFTGLFTPNALSDSLGAGEAAKTTLTFSSSGLVAIIPASDT